MVYYSIVISTLHCIMDLFCDFHIDGVRQERERCSFSAALRKRQADDRVGGGMPSKGDGGRAVDTSRPHHAYGTGGNKIRE